MKTGRNKNSEFLVALLLVVGLAAVSDSMRELAEIHQFTFNVSRLVAQEFLPAEVPAQVIVAKHESCESTPATEDEWLEDIDEIGESGADVAMQTARVEVSKATRRVRNKPLEVQVAKLSKLQKFDFAGAPFEFHVATDNNDDSDTPTPVQLPATMFKTKTRKPAIFRISPRDREIILKTLNRSINLRTAS